MILLARIALIASASLLLVGCAGCAKEGAPITVEKVEYIPGGFGSRPATVITSKDGSKTVLRGYIDVPPKGSTVVPVERNLCGESTYLKRVENKEQ